MSDGLLARCRQRTAGTWRRSSCCVSAMFHLPIVAVCRDYRGDLHVDVIHSRNESNLFDLVYEEYDVCAKFKVKFESMEGLDHATVCEK